MNKRHHDIFNYLQNDDLVRIDGDGVEERGDGGEFHNGTFHGFVQRLDEEGVLADVSIDGRWDYRLVLFPYDYVTGLQLIHREDQ